MPNIARRAPRVRYRRVPMWSACHLEPELTASDVVVYEVSEFVATITFNRPDRLNAWTPTMSERYGALLADAAADPNVRAIVVTGAGRAFCAGADMDILTTEGGGPAVVGSDPKNFATRALQVPKPVIAAINGPCAGYGVVLALACDVRFIADDAKLTSAFARRGLIAEYGSAWLLGRIVGPGRALDLLLSARVISGAEAERIGLAEFVCEDGRCLELARDYARDLAAHCSPASLAAIKRQIYADLERGLADSVEDSVREMDDSSATTRRRGRNTKLRGTTCSAICSSRSKGLLAARMIVIRDLRTMSRPPRPR